MPYISESIIPERTENKRSEPVCARVITFGRFDIFVNGAVVEFHNSKAKELIALCVDRCGGVVTIEEAIDCLWPEKCYDERVKRLYRKSVIYARDALERSGIPQIFVRSRGFCYVRSDLIECDYYDFLEDPERKKHMFRGEYMTNYSWAEKTLVWLEARTSGHDTVPEEGITGK